MALLGQRRAGDRRRPRCASASSPRSCARADLWDRAHEIAAGIARKPTAATQGTVRAIWESLDRPYRAAMQQGLIYTRLGNPIGMAEVAETRRRPPRAEAPLMARRATCPTLSRRIAEVLALDPAAPALEFERRVVLVGRPRRRGRRGRAARRAGRAGRRPAAQPPGRTSASCSVCSRAGACVVDRQPRAGRRARARRPRGARRRHRRRRAGRPRGPRARDAALVRRATQLGAVERRPASGPVDGAPTTPTAASGRRGRDAHQRHDRAAEAGRRSPTRRSRGCSTGAKHYERNPDADLRLRSRRRDRQLAARAPRRPVPDPAVRQRRPLVLPARALPGRRVGRRRAPPPPAHRQPRARRAAHGARGRPRPRRPRERPVGHLAAPRRSRPTTPTRSSRSTACRCSISYAATEFGGGVAGWNLADHEQFWAAKRGSVGPRPPGLRAARRRPRHRRAARRRRGGPARGEGPPARRRRRLDAHHRPRPHRRRRLRLDPRPGRPGDHPRRLQGAARRRARRARARPAGPGRGGRQPGRRAGSARSRSPRSSCAPARPRSRPDDLLADAAADVLARYELPTEIRIVDALPRTDSGKVDLAAVRRSLFGARRA